MSPIDWIILVVIGLLVVFAVFIYKGRKKESSCCGSSCSGCCQSCSCECKK